MFFFNATPPVRRISAIFLIALFLMLNVAETAARQQDNRISDPDNSPSGEPLNPALFADLSYRMVGPSRGGRVTAVAGHADQPGTFYFGATGGGVWKTTNYGASWDPISDQTFKTGSIGSIDVSDSNPDVIYVGTGSDGIRSNVILGKGVYKSEDAGETWEFVGLEDTGQIGAVVIHPTNPEVVWVAALGNPFGPNPERGVYKTTDGGASWKHVLFVSEKTGAVDLELNPDNPDEVYAALWYAERKPWTIISGSDTEDGIYKTTDAGETWKMLSGGLPDGTVGKIDLAVSPADPSRIYALVETAPEKEGLYRSNDRGETWHMVTNKRGLMNRPFYYTNVDADPSNADVVYVNNEGFYRSEDGGKTFQRRSTPHGDNHDMWINPKDTDLFVQSNDGGANVTRDGGETWSTQRNQPTAELYQVHVDDAFVYRLYAGQQDNSTISVPSLPVSGRAGGHTAYWESIGGCETGPAVPRPGDPNIVYSNCKGRFGRYNRETGQEQQYYVGAVNLYGRNPKELPYRFQRVVPIEVSPHNPDVIYHGSQYVHRTRDEGRTWETISPDLTAFRPERQVISGGPITRDITGEEHYSALYVIEESPVEPGVIWTGANDGPIHISRDNGATWTDVTPPDMPPEGRIQTIEPSPHSGGKAYFAGYRYLLGDFEPYIYRTTDYGQTWKRLTDGTNGIPDNTPTRVVREDPDREGLLYAGTEFGMYISFNDGGDWQSFQQNLPVTPITDIKVYRQDLVVSTMGRSFWIMDDISPLHALTSDVASSEKHLFQPRDVFRMRYRSSDGGSSGPQYPAPGVHVDYFLANDHDEEASIRILDDSGDLVREFDADVSENDAAAEEQEMREPSGRNSDPEPLVLNAGMHRFTWDLRHTGPLNKDLRHARGPLVVPGTYSVELTIGDWSETRRFKVLIDPRVEKDGVTLSDLQEQYSFNTQVGEAISTGWETVAKIDSTLKSYADADSSATDASETKSKRDPAVVQFISDLESIRELLVTDEKESYPPPMLMSQLSYLRGMTSRADQKPGRDAGLRYEELRAELHEIVRRVQVLVALSDSIGRAGENP